MLCLTAIPFLVYRRKGEIKSLQLDLTLHKDFINFFCRHLFSRACERQPVRMARQTKDVSSFGVLCHISFLKKNPKHRLIA